MKAKDNIALVIGATGMTGKELTMQLLKDERFSKVTVFVRRSTGIHHEKLEENIINFDSPSEWQDLVKGDVLFSALGTTLKKAGSKAAQYKIDVTHQYNFAKAASDNKVPVYVLISSAFTSLTSPFFYSRMKAELERDVSLLPFHCIHIFKPGPLWGQRSEKRTFEEINIKLIKLINRAGLLKKTRPLHSSELAQAMISVSFHDQEGIQYYELDEIFKL